MKERIEQERAWFRSFQQLIFGIFGVLLIVVFPVIAWTDHLFWGIVYTGLALVPVNVMYIRRSRMRQALNPPLTHRYRQQLRSDCFNTIAFFIAINGGELFESNVLYLGGLLMLIVAGLLTIRIEKQMKEEDVWRPTYEQLKG